MKVSFIMPAYKKRFLREAIASILAQTFRDFELVVVDDCSPEDLKEVVDEFHDERVAYHRNDENIGGRDLVLAWSHAMSYARGEWCVLASDDDVWLPQCLERLMRLVDKYPTCDLFHARCAYIDANGRWNDIAPGRLELESQIQMSYQRSVLRARQQAPDFMFRLSAWRRVGGFVNFPLAWYSDDASWMVLAKNGCAHTAEVSFLFRESGINLSSSHDALLSAKIDAGFAFFDWMKEFSKTLSPQTEEEKFILLKLMPGVEAAVRELIAYEFLNAKSYKVWCLALRHRRLTFHDRITAVYNRYVFVKALRLMLSKPIAAVRFFVRLCSKRRRSRSSSPSAMLP